MTTSLLRAAVNLCAAKTLICEYYSDNWKSDKVRVPNLRTYCLFKSEFQCDDYLLLDLRGCERSIETGRYTGLHADQRPDIEDEKHFLLNCDL